MTYSLNTFNAPRSSEPLTRPVWARFATEFGLLAGLVALVFWILALLSYSVSDAAWSSSGAGGLVNDRAAQPGAWVADLSYFGLGFSVWWCVAAAI